MSRMPDDKKPDPVDCPECGGTAAWVDFVYEDIETAFGVRGVPAGHKHRCSDCGNEITEWW